MNGRYLKFAEQQHYEKGFSFSFLTLTKQFSDNNVSLAFTQMDFGHPVNRGVSGIDGRRCLCSCIRFGKSQGDQIVT